MKFYVGVTDHDWFDFLRALSEVDEVNFWQPSPSAEFRALGKGDVFLFKLHRSERTHNQDLIAGGGVFASFSILPISLAWEAFEQKNGAASYGEMRQRLVKSAAASKKNMKTAGRIIHSTASPWAIFPGFRKIARKRNYLSG